jgi:adenylate cyclase
VTDSGVLRQVLQELDAAVAVVSPADHSVVFENASFFRWFPPGPADGETVVERIPGFRADRATERLATGRAYVFDGEASAGDRPEPVRVQVRTLDGPDGQVWVVEVHPIGAEMEARYMLDSYSQLAERNARDLEKEKERVERLLLNIMPRAVFEEMKEYGTATPQRFDSVSILMLDFVGFTDMTIAQDPTAIVSELNDIFSAFDRITDMFDCERVRTVGDAYVAVSGLLSPTPDHSINIARLALRFRRYLERRNAAHSQDWIARIGIHTGPVIGSLVGVQKYVYDLFGPGINFASRMETASEPMQITCNQETHDRLVDAFEFTDRGEAEIKGFGIQHLWFLDSELPGRR